MMDWLSVAHYIIPSYRAQDFSLWLVDIYSTSKRHRKEVEATFESFWVLFDGIYIGGCTLNSFALSDDSCVCSVYSVSEYDGFA